MNGKYYTEYRVIREDGTPVDDVVYTVEADVFDFVADATIDGMSGLIVAKRRVQIARSPWVRA